MQCMECIYPVFAAFSLGLEFHLLYILSTEEFFFKHSFPARGKTLRPLLELGRLRCSLLGRKRERYHPFSLRQFDKTSA